MQEEPEPRQYVTHFNKEQHNLWKQLHKQKKTVMDFPDFVRAAYCKEVVRLEKEA